MFNTIGKMKRVLILGDGARADVDVGILHILRALAAYRTSQPSSLQAFSEIQILNIEIISGNYNAPRKLDSCIRCMLACLREGGGRRW